MQKLSFDILMSLSRKYYYLIISFLIIFIGILAIFSYRSYFWLSRCNEVVIWIGYCYGMNWGIYYNKDSKKCEGIQVSWCSAKSPFKSIYECKNICE